MIAREEPATTFARRHIGPSSRDIAAMLETVGAKSLEALMNEALPPSIRQKTPLDLGEGFSETEVLTHMQALAAQNQPLTSLIGQGYSGTILPAVIQRNILENPAWYTAYTPYQPEISQGRLEALFNFQTMICDLTGLDVANASLLDEATAAAEAMALAERASSVKTKAFFVDHEVHPQTLAVLRTRAEPLGWTLVTGDPLHDLDKADVFGAVLQYPGTSGVVRDLRPAIAAIKAKGGLAVVAADLLALTLLTSPGVLGADIAIGSAQRFGVPMGYGGPHAAYMAVCNALKRLLPGRLVGLSVDSRGTPAYRLALQTREQHIRREKATSNICTAQVLLAVISSMYAVYHGPEGLAQIARTVHRHTATLAAGLTRLGFAPLNSTAFDTLTVNAGERQSEIVKRASSQGINLRINADGTLGIALDELTIEETVEALWRAFGATWSYADVEAHAPDLLPADLKRKTAYLTHPVFHEHRSETELLRYMRKLSDRDLALDRAMIPLGSCTMKLNATTEMIPLTWAAFANLHPFAPPEQAEGYFTLFENFEEWLLDITGYDAISLQPNSGAQGEYAGLLAIRGYHAARGESHRTVCLIPSSAHGTNPASANMAGMDVVVVACDARGDVDVDDLRTKSTQHADRLAAIMITYPSTHGVFEERIREICDIVHGHGGQVYLDGANMNAQVGLSRPGDYGADVSHLNLHKTFCIPHGGGGPGMGPIGVKAHLAPFLPGHPAIDDATPSAVGPVSAAPFGSASILTISYIYILMMGSEGLKRATEVAILNANYIAQRLDPHFPVLYRNVKGRVAHECIIDPRALKAKTGVTVDDIAKRLIDYGFHAPTMSFPVPGTLMIEPTESESKAELDRFCDAMIAIRQEIAEIEAGRWKVEASPLRHAPHTAHDIADDAWSRPYSRAQGCFPSGSSRSDKYWCPVGRVDNAYGDRNLVCSCPPVEDYAQAAE
ncbi:glycine dehydrogenase (decarboxylating) alpha subunit / glycine dehydrogenase (decarboxylating) beta subunit [Nitrobacter winogradskyi Nb-255]|uniref:Glycine dehydrogenase (decarboxylating) n=1 Tax=Nitrobacter winogradskyi (strain ATCC 25391 / DSM 10237 / CIP 104748 / NCIMB 11846 / Nb-255) TaxID=323098 RepID=GCSP_NITWN|nr:aminomethyl-transferring glycine dehydrogenase [Nitrobacter winogradskyi]Q3ST46.1 RecName: Full=Glycine dehydrogenase (decarboxylating); AltName: Full=Glycine cleavage system P-protein; AltName: Full=Glycine decarboxylase; AltName: Full=Glycine dehydrogenase (aminomethyl-transferring) [Nitrobacter winogradskyi Nb-255]ABA04545.1 glycine dehydrogenase (decarboxylating) alpha subunit / glycine dehydrogenase (decarboxylating) beta subunit [Nitrobacter winogradskyi Nb-255]